MSARSGCSHAGHGIGAVESRVRSAAISICSCRKSRTGPFVTPKNGVLMRCRSNQQRVGGIRARVKIDVVAGRADARDGQRPHFAEHVGDIARDARLDVFARDDGDGAGVSSTRSAMRMR